MSYPPRPQGTDAMAAEIRKLWAAIHSMRGAAGLTSATIGEGGLTIYNPETGARMFLGNGAIRVWSDFDENPDGYGRMYTDPDAGSNYFRLFAPYSDGNGRQNSFSIQGRTPSDDGAVFVYSDGLIQLVTQDGEAAPTGKIVLSTPELQLLGLPTTSSSSNMFLGFVGSLYTVALVTSSRRYKQDIEDAEVDPADVLALRARTWRDRYEVENDPDTKKRFVGFIAEELDEHPTLRQFVTYDDEGRPDAISYDRLSVALVVLAQDHEHRIRKVEAENDELRQIVADLSARVTALEEGS